MLDFKHAQGFLAAHADVSAYARLVKHGSGVLGGNLLVIDDEHPQQTRVD